MSKYNTCECGSKDTYISYAGKICCYPCFKPLREKEVVNINMYASVVEDDGGWSVKVSGKTKKYFSKYEDYALTEAKKYANKLNNPKEAL